MPSVTVSALPREIAPNIYWLGGCLATEIDGQVIHGHSSAYLIIGTERSLLVDTGNPQNWDEVSSALDLHLGDRELDYVFPTHPELPHSGNLARLMAKYPAMDVIGDVRDYHLFYPGSEPRLTARKPSFEVDLGGGYRFRIIEAMVRDLPNSQWGFEASQRVLFPADGFSFMHRPELSADDEDGDPAHLPGECGLTTSELSGPVNLEYAAFFTGSALYWSRFIDDADELFEKVGQLVTELGVTLIAPGHGNVVSDVQTVMPIMREAHRRAYRR